MSEQRGTDAPDDESVAEPFDQTNGLAEGLDGDSDGTAASDSGSAAERDADDGAGITGTDDVAGQGAIDAALIAGRQSGAR
ncbi:MAG: hypothetical protein ACTHJL_01660 [Amnibacterium sp.]